MQVMHSGDGHEIDNDNLHAATMEEVNLGHLEGPFSEKQLDGRFGKGAWLFNKRFALQQGTAENPKVRVIDDCRRSECQCILGFVYMCVLHRVHRHLSWCSSTSLDLWCLLDKVGDHRQAQGDHWCPTVKRTPNRCSNYTRSWQ